MINQLLAGSVDLHCHCGPSIMPRALDANQAAQEAASIGMRAVLVKDHYYSAAAVVNQLNALAGSTGVRLLSGVPLNNASGAFNRFVVEHGLNLGARMVWMPTLSAANHIEHEKGKGDPKGKFPNPEKAMPAPEPLTVLDESGKLKEEVKPILDAVARHDAVLSSGHLNIREIWPLFEEARKRGVKRLLVNHPTYIIGCSLDDVRALVRMGAYIEHSIGMFVPVTVEDNDRPDELHDVIEAAGVDRTFFGSDLGQRGNGHPIVGFQHIVNMLLDLQYRESDIRRMVSENAAKLIGLDEKMVDAAA